jgi:glycosyltransferase involved in cell wall biosynthesis
MASPPIKVLYALDWFPNPQTGGTETQFWRLFQALDRSVVKPKIMVLKPSRFLENHVVAEELEILHVARLRHVGSVMRLLRAMRRARREGFTIVHTYFNDSSMVFPLPFRLLGGHVVVSRRDLGFWYTKNNLRLLRLLRPAVDRVVCNSKAVGRVVSACEYYTSDRIRVIYNALGNSFHPPDESASRALFGITEDSFVLTVVANLRPIKRLHDLIEALVIIRNTFPTTRLVVVGGQHPGEHADYACQLTEMTRRLGLASAVLFPGVAEDAGQAIRASDVCVLPSESEGLANVLLEYGQFARPTVCTDAGGNPEVVLDGITGLLYPIGDVSALAARIIDLLADHPRRLQMGAAAKTHVESRFPLQECVRQHVELYHELMAE